MTNYFVTVYLVDRAYGGPEEGGWYFNCGERQKNRRGFVFQNDDKACTFCRRYNERLESSKKTPLRIKINGPILKDFGPYLAITLEE